MTPSSWIRRGIAIAAALCACAATSASAETVTLTFAIFDDPLYPSSYSQAGFIITSLYPDGGHLHAGDGNLWLHSREGSSPYQIRRIDGGSFDFLGFDYQGGDSVFVSDTGASYTILGEQPLATFAMPPSFHDVTYVNWYMNNPGDLDFPDPQWGSIDNVVLNIPAAPEPAPPAMFGIGVAGLLLAARRSQRRYAGGAGA
ncbi:hypothetical protein [Massilia sp. 9096]|uniref:hypothetical protein n=1 Tax=Massilia sp. 9096 TaxID=1500894 RepID=UPI000B07452C|nr:hypothetical protein [Massilia sp. 9096]